MQRRGERVGDVFQDDPDRGAPAIGPAQAARGQVVPVAQAFGGGQHPLGQPGGDARLPVHHPGNGLDADLGQGGDLPHRGSRSPGGLRFQGLPPCWSGISLVAV